MYYGWDFTNVWKISDSENSGYPQITELTTPLPVVIKGGGSKADPYIIENEEQLIALVNGELSKTAGVYYELGKDIRVSARHWTPVGANGTSAFAGVFDGKGYTISNVVLTNSEYADVGFFGGNTGTIKNLNVSISLDAGTRTGGITGYNSGTVENCTASGTVAGVSWVGGLVGSNYGSIIGSSSGATVRATENAGGLLGYNSGTVTQSYATGGVNGGTGSTGGLIGKSETGTVTHAYATGNVKGSGHTGGLVGENYTADSGTTSAIRYCYAKGTVSGSKSGGLVGYNWTRYGTGIIEYSYAHGDVSGAGNTGGLVGHNYKLYNDGNCEVKYCYATGNNSGSNKGGLIENNNGTVTSSYYDTSTSNCSDVDRGTPLATADMQTPASLVGWDFQTDWAIDAELNNGYPYLRSVVPPVITTIGVTGVTLNKSTLSLNAGESETLTATVQPLDATNRMVSWSSSDTSVAAVFSGKVNALKAGTATITVTTMDGEKTASCVVTVTENTVAVTGVSLNKTTLNLSVGSTEKLTAAITPANATNQTVSWTSSDESVASVTGGTINAKKAGTATITVTTADGGKTAICTVTVTEATVPVTGVSLDKFRLSMEIGDTETLTATVLPGNATDQSVSWSSSDEAVVTVSDGIVEAKGEGTATITVTTTDGQKTARCEVTVGAGVIAVTGITLDRFQLSMDAGNIETITATISPQDATNKNVTWSSSDETVAAVSDGRVTALKAGTATITVTTEDGRKTASCAVSVRAAAPAGVVTGVSLNKDTLTLSKGSTEKLEAMVEPENAEDKTVTWQSYNTLVASVSDDGTVTANQPGTAVVAVTTSDGNYTAACVVTVTADDIKGIEVTPPSRTTLSEGMPLDLTGMVVRLIYNSGESVEVTDYTLDGYESTVGEHTITVSYSAGEKIYTAEFTVTVTRAEVAGLLITSKPVKRTYKKGEELDLKGMVVVAMYSNGTTRQLGTGDYEVTGYNKDQAGVQTLAISYGGKSAQISVTVTETSEVPSKDVTAPRMGITSFQGGKQIELIQEDGADIYYTVDGTVPDTGSDKYTEPFMLTDTTTVKAIAAVDGKISSVLSGKISVPKTAAPVASHASGSTLTAGTIITLRTSTSGATIYYTLDGSTPSVEEGKYTGSIRVDRSVTIRAIAVKNGYQVSDVCEVKYEVPYTEPQKDHATIAVGSVQAMAGEAVSASVSIYTEGNTTVSSFRFTVSYDTKNFEYVSVSPMDETLSSKIFAAENREKGTVTIQCSDAALESGEVCMLNFNAVSSAEDGAYALTLSEEDVFVGTSSGNPLALKFESGQIMLEGSHNSRLSGEVSFTNNKGESITSTDGVAAGQEVSASINIDEPTGVIGSENHTANAFLAIYDRQGAMVNVDSWEIDLSDMQNLMFMHTIQIPEGVEIGAIKLMILSEEMTPLMAASSLAQK